MKQAHGDLWRLPADARCVTVEGGNIAVVGEGEHRTYRIVPAAERVGPLHLNHWVTCTDKPPRKS